MRASRINIFNDLWILATNYLGLIVGKSTNYLATGMLATRIVGRSANYRLFIVIIQRVSALPAVEWVSGSQNVAPALEIAYQLR